MALDEKSKWSLLGLAIFLGYLFYDTEHKIADADIMRAAKNGRLSSIKQVGQST